MFVILIFLLKVFCLQADPAPIKLEGMFWQQKDPLLYWERNIDSFLPYNPVILEVGAYLGEKTKSLKLRHPQGKIFAFEANPKTFEQLCKNLQNETNVFPCNWALNDRTGMVDFYLCTGIYGKGVESEALGSLLIPLPMYFPFLGGDVIRVPGICLDDWCIPGRENWGKADAVQNLSCNHERYIEAAIDHVDYIDLDVEGAELQVLKGASHVLKSVLIITTKTYLTEFRHGTGNYFELKDFLEEHGFVLFAHWYHEGAKGEAIFIRKYVFDALFK
jgi:FkbM family methyltransferase